MNGGRPSSFGCCATATELTESARKNAARKRLSDFKRRREREASRIRSEVVGKQEIPRFARDSRCREQTIPRFARDSRDAGRSIGSGRKHLERLSGDLFGP